MSFGYVKVSSSNFLFCMTTPLNDHLSVLDIDCRFPQLRGGIANPSLVTLQPQRLYRFSSTSTSGRAVLQSPWWFIQKEFSKLERFFHLDKGNPGFIARTQAAVRYEWSTMDALVVALLGKPIKVFQGPGQWQFERLKSGGSVVFQAPPDLLQTYIPGLERTAVDGNVLGALHLVRHVKLQGLDDVDRAILNAGPGSLVVIPGNPLLH